MPPGRGRDCASARGHGRRPRHHLPAARRIRSRDHGRRRHRGRTGRPDRAPAPDPPSHRHGHRGRTDCRTRARAPAGHRRGPPARASHPARARAPASHRPRLRAHPSHRARCRVRATPRFQPRDHRGRLRKHGRTHRRICLRARPNPGRPYGRCPAWGRFRSRSRAAARAVGTEVHASWSPTDHRKNDRGPLFTAPELTLAWCHLCTRGSSEHRAERALTSVPAMFHMKHHPSRVMFHTKRRQTEAAASTAEPVTG